MIWQKMCWQNYDIEMYHHKYNVRRLIFEKVKFNGSKHRINRRQSLTHARGGSYQRIFGNIFFPVYLCVKVSLYYYLYVRPVSLS